MDDVVLIQNLPKIIYLGLKKNQQEGTINKKIRVSQQGMGAGEIQAASTVLLSFQSFKLGGEIRGVYFITLHSSYVLHIYIYFFL